MDNLSLISFLFRAAGPHVTLTLLVGLASNPSSSRVSVRHLPVDLTPSLDSSAWAASSTNAEASTLGH